MIKICEIFESLQGEGAFCGTPMLFIRVSGCTRACDYCDTKYHSEEGEEMTVDELVKRIKESKLGYVCWTGGEPLLYIDQILKVVEKTRKKYFHHLETNGDLLDKFKKRRQFCNDKFDYIVISPKTLEVAIKANSEWYLGRNKSDIKVVTDLDKIGIDMLKQATMLMPLTTGNKEKNLEIRKKVWDYCVKHNIKYSPRLQVEIFGVNKRKI